MPVNFEAIGTITVLTTVRDAFLRRRMRRMRRPRIILGLGTRNRKLVVSLHSQFSTHLDLNQIIDYLDRIGNESREPYILRY